GGALAGLGASLSYAAIVRELEGVELAKHETRTDWLRRPLSADQIRYAQEDVAHLPEIERKLRQRLESLGRLAWDEAASAEVAAAALQRLPPDAGLRRLRG
ncbi:MAG: ribonuclease D, partial [Acidobacteria bacterium]|nr:ribonuclease D [Acidobacteriota bacterium]